MADKRKVLWGGSGLLRCATPFAGTINHRKPGSCPVAEFSRVPAYTPISQGGFSQALLLAGGDIGNLTGWHVLQAARDGDKMSVALVEGVSTYLGLGLANLANLFNPSLIVLDKRLSLAGDQFLEQIKRVVQRQALGHVTETLQFCYASLGDEAGLLGPALLVLDRIFEMQPVHPVSRNSKAVSRQEVGKTAVGA